ncbi:MAG: CehA/McbA family metallohydrolase [Candidatus Hydrogenedentes bacterium]|nr:CehA/McbA family metallohydrolase [Candidatus Hydrogenedentota bacterium]
MQRSTTSKLALALLLAATSLPARAHDGDHELLPQPPTLAQAGTRVTPPEAATCALTLRVIDTVTEKAIPALIHITDAQGQTIRPAELLPRSTALNGKTVGEAAFAYMDRWYILPSERTIEVPADAARVDVFSGLEWSAVEQPLNLRGKTGATVELRLDRFHTPVEHAGNVHLHLKEMTLPEAERYVTETAAADGLDLVFLSYLERPGADAQYISNSFTAPDLRRFEEHSGVIFGYGEEYRHNFPRAEGYGHVMFLDLPQLILPASLGADIMKQGNDDIGLRGGIEAARRQAATILWCHNARGFEDIPSWVSGLLDGQIVFDGGATGGYERGFYRYLNVGLEVPIAMGTDWFLNDMAMTMVRLEDTPATANWLAALREGKSYITNGPLLEFSVDGARAGAIIEPGPDGSVRVHGRAIGRNDFKALELVANGAVIARADSKATTGAFEADIDQTVAVRESTWLALRTVPFEVNYDRPEAVSIGFNEYGRPLFAHTSPIYARVAGKPVFLPEAAEDLIAELHSCMVTIGRTGNFGSEAARDSVLAVYEAARVALEKKLGR